MRTLGYVLLIMAIGRISLKTKFDEQINRISGEHGNDPNLVKAIIKVESNFNPKAHRKTSREDSRGLGQINVPTAELLNLNVNRLFDPQYNILAINLLIIDLKKRFPSTQDLVAAYNAGSVKRRKDGTYINNSYVINVMARYAIYSLVFFVPENFSL